mmetsp:Transcript_10948/g.21666  ORF Transcript_10948/g.21666 Transcript_10948/m.21666 type:complete len:336 (-) Transcript_10948:2050-3057(-)
MRPCAGRHRDAPPPAPTPPSPHGARVPLFPAAPPRDRGRPADARLLRPPARRVGPAAPRHLRRYFHAEPADARPHGAVRGVAGAAVFGDRGARHPAAGGSARGRGDAGAPAGAAAAGGGARTDRGVRVAPVALRADGGRGRSVPAPPRPPPRVPDQQAVPRHVHVVCDAGHAVFVVVVSAARVPELFLPQPEDEPPLHLAAAAPPSEARAAAPAGGRSVPVDVGDRPHERRGDYQPGGIRRAHLSAVPPPRAALHHQDGPVLLLDHTAAQFYGGGEPGKFQREGVHGETFLHGFHEVYDGQREYPESQAVGTLCRGISTHGYCDPGASRGIQCLQ